MDATFLLASAVAPQSPEPQLIDVDATLYIQLGLFILVAFLLARFLWGPYLKVRNERVSRVEGYREEAARLEAEAAGRLAQLEAALAEARRVGSAERGAARAEAQAREQALLAEANAAAQRQLGDARTRLQAMVADERGKLEQQAAEAGREAARKILGREVAA
jgi:F-type H+-transporting ATPase subunit b